MADYDKWYFTRKELEENSPSRRDGISFKKENQLRRKCIRFIVENGNKFRIHKSVIVTANVFCHRFFVLRSYAKHKWYRIAIASLFLASKVEDRGIRLDTFGEEGWRETLKEVFKEEIPFCEHKEMIIEDERKILIAIDFEMIVNHPYTYFNKALREIKDVPGEVCPVAEGYIDRYYFTSLCLQFKPQKIAGAAFHLAYEFLKLKLPFQEQDGYREFFQMTHNELEDISSQMIDLYDYKPPPRTAPDNQSEPSSSQPGNQSLSASASTSAPPSLLAAHGNQIPQPPAAPSNQSPPASSPPSAAPGKQSLTASLHPPGKQSSPSSSPLPAPPSNQNPPKPAAVSIQILPSPAALGHQSLSHPKQNPPASSPSPAPSKKRPLVTDTCQYNLRKPPQPAPPINQIPPAPVSPSNQSPPPPVAASNQSPPPPDTPGS